MNSDELLARLFQVIAYDIRHTYYNHVNRKAKLYNQLVSGVDMDDLLKQFVRREDKALFDQRVAITQHVTKAICKHLLDPFYKVPRSNSARRVITFEGEGKDERVAKLEGILSKFWGNESFDDYMSTRYVELNATDPNSYVVFEWDAFDPTKENLQPRPFEVSSRSAIMPHYKNRNLEYLICENTHMYRVKPTGLQESGLVDPSKVFKQGKKYTAYGPNSTVQLLQVSDSAFESYQAEPEGVIFPGIIAGEPVEVVKLKGDYYQILKFDPHNLGMVPAFCVGYNRDSATGGQTYVNQLDAAESYILKTVKTNSELDLVATLLAMPQQVRYGTPCVDVKCFDGYYEGGATCQTCNGSGVQPTAPSAQDAIVLKKPEGKEDFIPLSEMIVYIGPKVDIVQWQDEYVKGLTVKAKRVMYNSDIFDKAEVASTATGKSLDMQNVYDTLHPFAIGYSKKFTFGVTVIAGLTDMGKDGVFGLFFGKDFKLKTLDTLILDLKEASGLGHTSLVRHIQTDIARIILSEKPLELLRYEFKEMYSPFAGKSESEVMVLLSSPYVSRRLKVLHAQLGYIFEELEMDYLAKGQDFYKLKRVDQRTAIYAKVDEIIAEIDAENPEPTLTLE